MKAKYGIVDCDLYNFDETGFTMGMVQPDMIATSAGRKGRRKKEANSTGKPRMGYGQCLYHQYHLPNWYTETDLPGDWMLKTTTNRETDNETRIDELKHFYRYATSRTEGMYRILLLDGHESHISAEFDEYCEYNKIISLSLPPHSSHLTQPIDVGYFSPLKRAYGKEIKALWRL